MTAPAGMNATASKAGDLSAALDRAIVALTYLDATALEGIEDSVSVLLDGTDARSFFGTSAFERKEELDRITARHRLLGALLASTNRNLSVLERLHSRNVLGDMSWAR